MLVKALYFGGLRAALGRAEDELELPEGSQVALALAKVLSGLGPDWALALRCAVNEDFAPLDRVLQPGDEVAFLPPVAGGSGALRPQPSQTGTDAVTHYPIEASNEKAAALRPRGAEPDRSAPGR
jgi:molybdopterin converting factor small subunit